MGQQLTAKEVLLFVVGGPRPPKRSKEFRALKITLLLCKSIFFSTEHEELLDAKDYLASTGNEVNGLTVDGQFRG